MWFVSSFVKYLKGMRTIRTMLSRYSKPTTVWSHWQWTGRGCDAWNMQLATIWMFTCRGLTKRKYQQQTRNSLLLHYHRPKLLHNKNCKKLFQKIQEISFPTTKKTGSSNLRSSAETFQPVQCLWGICCLKVLLGVGANQNSDQDRPNFQWVFPIILLFLFFPHLRIEPTERQENKTKNKKQTHHNDGACVRFTRATNGGIALDQKSRIVTDSKSDWTKRGAVRHNFKSR